ncbi:MAG: chromosome segregation protein SMC, partial [Bacteroidetes bacterium]
EATEAQVNELKDKVYKTNRLLDAKQNEYNLTKSLVENLEGFPESVKFLRKNARWIQQAPLLSDVFGCPDELRIAFENYLDPYLSYYIVGSRQDAILAIHLLADSSKGRANFFILDELEHYKPRNPLIFTQATPALDIVEFAPEYRKLAAFLLDNVYIVNKESEFPEDIPEGTVFLSRAGNMQRRPFIMSGGSLGLFEGKRLGRAKNLEKLEKEIAKLQKQLTGEKVQLDKAQSKLQQLKGINIRKELEPAQRQLVEKQRDLSALSSREKEYREFLQRVGMRTESLQQELESLTQALAAIEPALRQSEERQQQLASRLEQQRQLTEEISRQLSELSQQYNAEHIKLIHLQNQAENLQREITQREAQIQRFDEVNSQLKTDKEQVIADTEALIQSNLQDDEVIVQLYAQKKQMEERVTALEQKVALTKSSIYQVEEVLAELRKKREGLLEKQNQLKESATEIKLEINSLKERMSVEFQVDLNELDEESLFDKPLEEYGLESLQEKLQKIRNRVQNYGEINPLAIEAFNEMKERFDFISGQRQDLLDAKASLLDTIAEIDEKAKERFLATYEQVRENFQKVFRTLFSEDDTCDLILRDAENPLESEIDIVARPKGKRPLTINQLSGGEKTLTAVALLFSIYLIKPAPFCVFDEVDAPLDDANIDKFNNIIRDFSSESQFIIVTHNKRTMAATNVMYGVTMKEGHGFSQVLPVDLETLNLN